MRERLMIGRLMLLVAAFSVLWSRGGVADTTDVVRSTLDAISNTAAVVEGRVTEITYTYEPAAGPRTVATLSDVTTHFGGFGDRTLRVATLGGPISKTGRWLFIPELPRLTADTSYLLFLTNVDWFYTPVVGNYIFRLELGPQGKDVLIDPSGRAVVGISSAGLQLTRDPVVDDKLDFLRRRTPSRDCSTANVLSSQGPCRRRHSCPRSGSSSRPYLSEASSEGFRPPVAYGIAGMLRPRPWTMPRLTQSQPTI